jgi:uncharacterized protein (TIGR02118 family)
VPAAKIVVLYPHPTDAEEFERAYRDQHLPMVVEKVRGVSKGVITRVVGAPGGQAPFYRMAELHFPSMEALQAAASSAGGQETIAHAFQISTGGPPIVMIAEEETMTP